MSSIAWLAALLGAYFLWVGLQHHYNQRRLALPPGPKGLPIIGNLRDMPLTGLWFPAQKWAREFGELVYLNIFGQGILFVNTYDAAVELFERRGAIYSDKPKMIMAGELCGCENMIGLTPYGDRLRRQRKLMLQALGPGRIEAYHPLLEIQTHSLLQGILNAPDDSLSIVRRYTGGLTLLIVYGYRVLSTTDRLLEMAGESLELLSNRIAGSGVVWLVDLFPALKHIPAWFPGAQFKRDAAVWKRQMEAFVNEPFEFTQRQMREGSAVPCYVTMLLDDAALENKDGAVGAQREADIRWTANSLYAASFDTTISAISHFLLAMLQHPDIQAKAQAELDAVLGAGPARLPTFADRARLPYVDAVVCEALRVACPVPLGLPRRVSEDNVYNGKLIPRGTLVFGNNYNMVRDPALFPNPDVFDPERFLSPSSSASAAACASADEQSKKMHDVRTYVFGFGRRRCPGAHMIDASLWIALASLLAAFDVRRATDARGRPVEPEVVYDNSVFTTMRPFRFEMRPRSAAAVGVVRAARGLED